MLIEPTAGAIEGREHLLPVRVYYEDTDAGGVVYHASYLRFLERGRTDCLRVLGVSQQAMLASDEPVAFVVRRMSLDFIKAARLDDALVVRTAFDGSKGVRLFIRQSIARAGETILIAEVEVVCIRPDGRPTRLPDHVAKALQLSGDGSAP